MTAELRILTVRNPWAWAIIHGQKDVENRVRNVAGGYRGPIAIHVALKAGDLDYHDPRYGLIFPPCPNGGGGHNRWHCDWCMRIEPQRWTRTGSIIGVVDLENVHEARDCWTGVALLDGTTHEEHCSVWGEVDHHHLVLANPRPLATPIPYKGALGLRRLPEDVAAAVWAEVAS